MAAVKEIQAVQLPLGHIFRLRNYHYHIYRPLGGSTLFSVLDNKICTYSTRWRHRTVIQFNIWKSDNSLLRNALCLYRNLQPLSFADGKHLRIVKIQVSGSLFHRKFQHCHFIRSSCEILRWIKNTNCIRNPVQNILYLLTRQTVNGLLSMCTHGKSCHY